MAITVFLVALGVFFPSLLAAGEKTMTVGMEQSGQEVTIKVGDLIRVELAATGGTGYAWYFDGLDAQFLELVSEETRKTAAEGLVGGPVVHSWRLRAKQAGRTEITMDYYRQWEGLGKAVQHFRLQVVIVQNGP